jgi:phosphatidylserine decarboxylase
MPTSLAEWLPAAKKKYENIDWNHWSHEDFLRDPCRAQRVDSRYFFSPADGVIIGQACVSPDDDVVEAKGVEVTLADLMKPWPIDQPCLVINIFMTALDVHINRMPTGGILTHEPAGPIRTSNLPMLWIEKGIIEKGVIFKKGMQYVKDNARMLNRVWSTNLGFWYYMVQIADSDVSAIMPFDHRKHAPLAQSERFSLVRWGSQVALVIPLDPRYRFRTLCNVTDHVEAGTDPLVKMEEHRR